MTKEIAKQWLHDVVRTADSKDHVAHMDLISRCVRLHGMPEYENIGYDDWSKQCKYEFENDLLQSIRYDGLKLLAITSNNIMFKTFETVTATDGTINARGVEMLLEKEQDGKWRLVQERILPADETLRDELIPTP